MATRMALGLRRLTIGSMVGLVIVLLGHGRAYAAHPIRIHAPTPDSTVSDMVTTSVLIKPVVKRVAFLVDGNLMSSSSSTSYTWDSTVVANGPAYHLGQRLFIIRPAAAYSLGDG